MTVQMDTQVKDHETRRQFAARTGWRSDSAIFAGWRADETWAQFRARRARHDGGADHVARLDGAPEPDWLARLNVNRPLETVTKADAKNGGDTEETEPDAEGARKGMVDRKKDGWKQSKKDRGKTIEATPSRAVAERKAHNEEAARDGQRRATGEAPDRNAALAEQQASQYAATGEQATSQLAAREARDPVDELDEARNLAMTAFKKRCAQ